jgi:hypothetical protein
MSTLSLPVTSLIDANREGYQNDRSARENDSLLWQGMPPDLDGSGAGPVAPEFARLTRAMAAGEQAPSLGKLSEALVGDIVTMLEDRGVIQDAFQATELLRQMQESQFEIAREVARLIFISLASTMPGADKDLPTAQLEASMRRVLPRVDFTALASPAERHFPLVQMDLRQYVTPPTYGKLAELESILIDARQRLQRTRGQEIQIQAVKTLTSLTYQAMRDAGSGDVIPRQTVMSFTLAQRLVTHAGEDILKRLILGIVARFASGQRTEELAHQLLKPLNIPVLTGMERAALRVKSDESQIFAIRIRPALQTEILRTALRADHARAVTLDPRQLRAGLQTPMLGSALVRKAIFGSEQVYSRWLMVAERMQQVEARRPGTFRALSLQAPSEGEAHGLVFAPATLAHFMSDPASARALLQALRAPGQLAQSTIALRLRAESLEEIQGEEKRV